MHKICKKAQNEIMTKQAQNELKIYIYIYLKTEA